MIAYWWKEAGPGLPHDVMRSHSEIVTAYNSQQTGFMVEFTATVTRLLRTDPAEGPYQRFIVQLSNGHSIMVHHNIELSKPVPVRPGDTVTIHGEYRWNAQGGVVQWTHRDPGFGIKHGWIEFDYVRYD
jgi:translation initiation factor IF-1